MNKRAFASDTPHIAYCTRCLEPTTRPDATFDDDGVCMPCRHVAKLDEIDWAARRGEIEDIARWGRDHSRAPYDCIVGVSGGKDSTRQAYFAREELGLKPLLVSCAYPPEHQTERGAANLGNLAAKGFDIHIVGPAPPVSKALMKESFVRYGNLFRATELALYSSIPIVAIGQGIPLIFLGENPALAFGGNVGSLDGSANQLRQQNTLGGADLAPWLGMGFERKDMFWYAYPPDRDVKRAGLRMVYLGYYMKDFNDIVNSDFSLSRGLTPRQGVDADPAETGSINPADALDEEFVHVNQFLKYLKLGFGKVTQQASVQVRYGKCTREQALELVRKYDGRCSERYIRKLCNYLDMSLEEFWEHAGRHRNLDLWHLDNQGEWQLRYKPI